MGVTQKFGQFCWLFGRENYIFESQDFFSLLILGNAFGFLWIFSKGQTIGVGIKRQLFHKIAVQRLYISIWIWGMQVAGIA